MPYDSWDQYRDLLEEALKKVQDVTNTELLSGMAHSAHDDFYQLGCETKWRQKCIESLMELTLNHSKQWCVETYNKLWFVLRQCLLTTLLFLENDIKTKPDAPINQFPHVKTAACNAVDDFFDEHIDPTLSEFFELVPYDEENISRGGFEMIPRDQVYRE